MDEREEQKDKAATDHKFWRGGVWLFWWRVQKEKLEFQVEQYHTLKITQSARGISFLLLLFSGVVSLIFAYFVFNLGIFSLFDIFISFVLGYFIYRGHKWAIVSAMIFWTLGKFLLILDNISAADKLPILVSQIITQIIWWSFYMHAFYVALKVEMLRQKQERHGRRPSLTG
ncbi:MAG: hypothetical protein GXP46_11445 [Deferribacteres bacterium]|nr:hypothetical protein [Deferribacteres bacterium]